VASESLKPQQVGQQLDDVRDRWIESNLEQWLSLHSFYPGVINWLQRMIDSSIELKIVTTKEGRFVQQLLKQQGVDLAAEAIFGKEVKRPKPETLRRILAEAQLDRLFFVEDRLKTLELTTQQPDLAQVDLFLADWGYNTESERLAAQQHSRIRLISLAQLISDDFDW
jgi:phosphoglycolate phosphatase-like HAD superfamily hydrolase